MGMFLNSFIRHADVVKMANLAQLVNVIAPIFTNKQGLYLQTTYFPHRRIREAARPASLDVLVESPQYKPDARARARLPRRVRDLRPEDEAGLRERAEPEREDGHHRARRERRGRARGTGERLGAEQPRPQGHPHLRQRQGGAAGDAQRDA